MTDPFSQPSRRRPSSAARCEVLGLTVFVEVEPGDHPSPLKNATRPTYQRFCCAPRRIALATLLHHCLSVCTWARHLTLVAVVLHLNDFVRSSSKVHYGVIWSRSSLVGVWTLLAIEHTSACFGWPAVPLNGPQCRFSASPSPSSVHSSLSLMCRIILTLSHRLNSLGMQQRPPRATKDPFAALTRKNDQPR